MKNFQSINFVLILALIVWSIFDIIKGLALLCFFLGLKELISAKEYFDIGEKKQSFLSLVMGIGVCICSIISLTNIL